MFFLNQEQLDILESLEEYPSHECAELWISSRFRDLCPTISDAEFKLQPLINIGYLTVDKDGRSADVTTAGKKGINLRKVLQAAFDITEKQNKCISSVDVANRLGMEIHRVEGFLNNLDNMGLLKLKTYSSHTFAKGLSEDTYIERITSDGKVALFSPEDLISPIPMTQNTNNNITNINSESIHIENLLSGSGNFTNNSISDKTFLAEVAALMQQLLKQLEQINPSASESEQVQYVNIATRPELKERVKAALQAGGEKAIEEFFTENKYLKVGQAIIKGWITGKA